jgi:hypothetical protein
LVADVVDVVIDVVELDTAGPDSPGLGPADASAAAPMMTMQATEPIARSMRIMVALRFRCAPSAHPYLVYERRTPSGSNTSPADARSPDDKADERVNFPAPSDVVLDIGGLMMRNSDRAWMALCGGVAAYDLIATDDEQLTNAARRYFKSQPIATASMIVVTGLHLIGGIPPWCDPIALSFTGCRRLLLAAMATPKKRPSGPAWWLRRQHPLIAQSLPGERASITATSWVRPTIPRGTGGG